MPDFQEYRKIYRAVLDVLEASPAGRKEIIDFVIDTYNLSDSELKDTRTNAKKNVIRSRAGAIINEMHARGIIARGSDGIYFQSTEKPVALRIEMCEEELLSVLSGGVKMTRAQIREELVRVCKTDSTATKRDDSQLFTYIGQILKHLSSERILCTDGLYYYIPEAVSATVRDRKEMLSLKGEFLRRLHAKGGEFFEHYFMNLLSKYLNRCGKVVTESYVTGGADDGGIDGVAKTVDSLGFRELIMVQTKNRNIAASETEIRGFYGAVCARQGSRGIFATTSEFHSVAKEFLDSIDNCVGVDGDKIFSMATDTSYGILRNGDKLIIDSEII